MAKAKPWKRMLTAAAKMSDIGRPSRSPPRFRLLRGHVGLAQRVRHAEIFELHDGELVALLLNPPHIDVLNDLARRRVDHHRALRALVGFPALEEVHRLVTGELALGL